MGYFPTKMVCNACKHVWTKAFASYDMSYTGNWSDTCDQCQSKDIVPATLIEREGKYVYIPALRWEED